jgi:hypothetical protein
MTIALSSNLRWWLAIPLLALASPGAAAGPENCLTLRENAAVAQCANQYAPAHAPTYGRDRPAAATPGPRYAAARPEDALQAVPVPTQKPAALPAEPSSVFAGPDHYAFILNGMAISGIAGFLVLAAVGWIWRLKGASTKRCPFCSARVSSNAHVCKSCFRVI